MLRVRHRWALLALAGWVLTPIAVLALRAVSPTWRYPQMLSETVEIGGALDGVLRSGVATAALTSLWLALATGILGTVLGFFTARLATRATGRLEQAVMSLAFFLVIAPPLAAGVGLQVVTLTLGIGGTGLGVLLAHLVPASGYLTLFAAGVFINMEPAIEDEARTLGASRYQVWSRVLLPMLAPHLAEGLVLGALVSWGQLALTLLVGGGVVRTLPVEVLSLVRSGNDQAGALAALALSLPPALGLGLLARAARQTGATV